LRRSSQTDDWRGTLTGSSVGQSAACPFATPHSGQPVAVTGPLMFRRGISSLTPSASSAALMSVSADCA
jgi:hypothetical protein